MRYYIYIDKNFIKNIFASDEINNFGIEIITYSVQEGETIQKSNNLSPRVDFSEDEFNEKEKILENDNKKKKRKGDIRKRNDNSLEISTSNANTYNKVIEKKYINIEEVSDIKNINFFHKMIMNIEDKCIKDKRLIHETGNIIFYKLVNNENNDNIFLYINNKYYWIDKNLLNCDINMLIGLKSNISVCGYILNTNTYKKVIKVIAMYM